MREVDAKLALNKLQTTNGCRGLGCAPLYKPYVGLLPGSSGHFCVYSRIHELTAPRVSCVPHVFYFQPSDQRNRLSVCNKLCYAIGGAPYQITGTALGFFLQIYLLDVAQVTDGRRGKRPSPRSARQHSRPCTSRKMKCAKQTQAYLMFLLCLR